MPLLYTMLGLHLIFGTKLGCALFAILGGTFMVMLLLNGKLTATSTLLLLAVAYAAKRVFRR